MTGITQKIPNYIGGISQQPDELMPPGSVRDALNVLPDVTNGLTKRSGSRLLNPLVTDDSGKWFHIARDQFEKYIGKINLDGTVEMWNINEGGLPVPVNYSDVPPGVQPIDQPPQTGYPDCSWERVTEALFNMSEANQRMGEAQGYLDGLLEQYAKGFTATSTRTFFKTDKYQYPGLIVTAGYIGKEPVGPFPGDKETKYKRGKLKKKGKTVWVPNPNFSDDPNQREMEYLPKNNKDLYEMVWETTVEVVDERELEKDIADARAEYEAKQYTYKQARKIYVDELAKCGKEYGDFNRVMDTPDDIVIPDYFKQTQGDKPLEVLTINDFTFVTNPNIPVTMSKSDAELRDPEAFLQITAMAYAREYSLNIKEEDSDNVSYRTVTSLSLASQQKWLGDDASCPDNGTQTYTVTGDDMVTKRGGYEKCSNLVFELNVRGNSRQVVDKPTKPEHYKCSYTAFVTLKAGGANWKVGDEVEVTLAGQRHIIQVDSVETIETFGNIDIHPPVTTNDGDALLSQQQLLQSIKTTIDDDPRCLGYEVELIGGGLYITNSTIDFTISTPETTLMKVITDEANDVSYLPAECKDGYVCKIANTGEDYDDYWVKFETEQTGVDGAGTWVECRKPGIFSTFNKATMPHQIIREEDGSFTVCPVAWEERLVGDDLTNPIPSFCSRPVGYPKIYTYAEDDPDTDVSEYEANLDQRFIQKMVFFRNRLTILSGENVVASKPGDYFNFFAGSALTVAANDPIDISAASTQPTVLIDAIEVTEGLLCFGPSQQHLLSTDSEIFGPRSARFNKVGTLRYSGEPVFSLGTTIGFTQKGGLRTRVLELTSVSRSKESQSQELSKPVSNLIPDDVDLITNSNDNNLLILGKRDTKEMYLYRYFQNDDTRVQSSWFRWELPGYSIYQAIIDDTLYLISWNFSDSPGVGKIISLQQIDLKDTLSTSLVAPNYDKDGDVTFETHLDNYRVAFPSDAQYYQHLDQTYFAAPIIYYNDENLVAYALSPNEIQAESGRQFTLVGSAIPVKVDVDTQGTWFVLDGDWSGTRLMIGYEFNMSVELPIFYPLKTANIGGQTVSRADTRADIRLHRAKINFGNAGVYNTTLKRKGREDYTQLYESAPADFYLANEVAFLPGKEQTVPIYSKNTDVRFVISSTHPSPATLYSVEWEGNFSKLGYSAI